MFSKQLSLSETILKLNKSHKFRLLYLKVFSDLDSPDGLLKRVEELEAEAVLLGGPLDQLAGIEQHCPHPLSVFVSFINEQDAWFQHTPQLRPALQSATDLELEHKHMKTILKS